MNKKTKTYNPLQLTSSVCMILALLWLTVSMPFVNAAQQHLSSLSDQQTEQSFPPINSDEDASNPFGNNTEEKASGSSSSFSEEYLHDHHASSHFFSISHQYHKCQNAGTYTAFHGELLVPPPNQG